MIYNDLRNQKGLACIPNGVEIIDLNISFSLTLKTKIIDKY